MTNWMNKAIAVLGLSMKREFNISYGPKGTTVVVSVAVQRHLATHRFCN